MSPQGTVPSPFSFAFSQVKPTQLSGGSVKVVDSSTFKVSTAIAAAEVTVEPGAMRYSGYIILCTQISPNMTGSFT